MRLRIEREFALFPWFHETIERYENLGDPESRFIKALDKAMPARLHTLNDGAFFEKEEYRDPERLQNGYVTRAGFTGRKAIRATDKATCAPRPCSPCRSAKH